MNKKNRKKDPLKILKAVIICGAFFLILGASLDIFITETQAHAAQINVIGITLPILDPTPTPTSPPIPTPTLPPVSTPIPSPSPIPTPMPMPTKAPAPTATPKPAPTPTPERPIQQPTPTVMGGGIIPPASLPTTTITPTPKPTPTPQATATPTPNAPTAVATTAANSTGSPASTQDQSQAAGNGMNAFIMPIAFGLGLAILISIVLAIIFSRKQKGHKPLPFSTYSQALSQTAQPTPWLHQSNANAVFAAPGGDHVGAAAAAAAANEQTQIQQAALSVMPAAIAMPSTTQKRPVVANPGRASFNQAGKQNSFETLPYPPSGDLRPITSPLPTLGVAFPQKNPVSTSDMNPFPLDNLDFATIMSPDNEYHEAHSDDLTQTGKNPIAASSLIAPSIQDDPILETIMRQAQMGIYAIADKYPSDPSDDIADALSQ